MSHTNAVHPRVLAHNVRLMASVTTNAVLLEPRLDELLSAQITGFQITLEGVSSVHDQTRVGPDRKPTFPIIWSALTSLRNHVRQHTTTIRVHYRAETVKQLPEFVSHIGDAPARGLLMRSIIAISYWSSNFSDSNRPDFWCTSACEIEHEPRKLVPQIFGQNKRKSAARKPRSRPVTAARLMRTRLAQPTFNRSETIPQLCQRR